MIRSRQRGFTLIELLVVIAIIAILAGMLLPALAKAKAKSQGILCMGNNKQLVLGWHLYTGDYNEKVPNNFTIPDTLLAISSGKFNNWVNNVMTWDAGTDTQSISVTNIAWVKNGVLAPYTAGAVGIYQCPADNKVSAAQRKKGWTRRMRSNSMNAYFGRSDNNSATLSGRSWAEGQAWRQFLKTSDVPRPASTWLTLDEHPDSSNDAFFVVGSGNTDHWDDYPSSLHNGACGFSFADGHAEIKKWQGARSKIPVTTTGLNIGSIGVDAGIKADLKWYTERVQYIR